MQECKGICTRFDIISYSHLYYKHGAVFCRICNLHFIKKGSGRDCPCCHSAVRNHGKGARIRSRREQEREQRLLRQQIPILCIS